MQIINMTSLNYKDTMSLIHDSTFQICARDRTVMDMVNVCDMLVLSFVTVRVAMVEISVR